LISRETSLQYLTANSRGGGGGDSSSSYVGSFTRSFFDQMSVGRQLTTGTTACYLNEAPGGYLELARGLWVVMQEMVDEEVGSASGEWSSTMLPSQKILQEGLKNVYVRGPQSIGFQW